MIEVGSKVKIKEDLTYETTGIQEDCLAELRGKETVVKEIETNKKGEGCLTLEIDESWCFDGKWIEEVVEEK